jgi:RNA polymerase sigma-70 factor (ECF subfamily)
VSEEIEAVELFQAHRALLLGIAYQVLGSSAEAEDVVQETWLRWDRADRAGIASPRAWLVKVATRLALDRLRSARARREHYVGPWLPEPLVTGPDVAEDAELAESVSMAMLVVLETLSPLERAVFVLREAFGFSHAEIAATLGRSEPAVRQLAHRAREHVQARRPRFQADRGVRRRATERFLAACVDGDLDGLLALLAPEVTLWADGGGRAPAPRRPLRGASKVARFLVAVAGDAPADIAVHLLDLNGGPAAVLSSAGSPYAALVLELAGDRVEKIRLVVNPDKLAALRVG